MTVYVTPHGGRAIDIRGGGEDALGAQVADELTAASNVFTFPEDGLYRVYADAAHTIRIGGSTLNAATGGEKWPSGRVEVRYGNKGGKLVYA